MDQYLEHIRNFEKQLNRKAIQLFNIGGQSKSAKPDAVVVIGMGGSGLAADLLLNLQDFLKLKAPVIQWKDYGLPTLHAKRLPLFVFVSFSGNTAETISALKKLLKDEVGAAAIVTTGGELKRLALKEKLPLAIFSARDLTPRESLGYTFFSLKLLIKAYFPEIRLYDFSQRIKPAKLERLGQTLARKIKGRVPIIYTPTEDAALGYIWKINFNETAKNHAFSSIIPEAAHNEINAFGKDKKTFIPIFLLSQKTLPIIKTKIGFVTKILKKNGILPIFVQIPGKNREEVAWNTVILSHFAAYYLAKLNKVNPQETRLIDQLKKLEK